MVAVYIIPAIFIDYEHERHSGNIAPFYSRVKASCIGIVFRVQVDADIHALTVHDLHLHSRVRVIVAGSRQRDHVGVMIDQEPDVLQIGAVQCMVFDDFVIPTYVGALIEYDGSAGEDFASFVFFGADLKIKRSDFLRHCLLQSFRRSSNTRLGLCDYLRPLPAEGSISLLHR